MVAGPGDPYATIAVLRDQCERQQAEMKLLKAEAERLRGVVEAGKALLIQSQLKEDRSNWEEWYEVCVPEWEALRAALAEPKAKP